MGVIIGKGNERYCYAVINSMRNPKRSRHASGPLDEVNGDGNDRCSKPFPFSVYWRWTGNPFEGRFSVSRGN